MRARSDCEVDLVRRAVEDVDAFGELVERYRGAICRQCRAAVSDWHHAEDLAQETFIRAYLKLGQLRDPARFGPWLRRIAANACKEFARQPSRREVPWEFLPEPAAPEASPVGRDLLLASLPEEMRRCLELFYERQMGYAEVAAVMGVSVGTVRNRLHRAKALLREDAGPMSAEEKSAFTRRVLERLERLRAGGREERARAARDLHTALAEDRVDWLVSLLQSPDPQQRTFTIRPASRVHSPRVRDALIEMLLHDGWEENRLKAAGALAAQGDPAAIPALREAAGAAGNPSDVRAAARCALRELERRETPPDTDTPLLRLRDDLGTATADRRSRVELLRRLRAALEDADPRVRNQTVKALGELGDKRAAPCVAKLLRDPAPGIRQAAAHTLGRLKSPRGIRPLEQVLDASNDPRLLQVASRSLGEIGDRRALPALLAVMEKTRPGNRGILVLAGRAIEKLATPQDLSLIHAGIEALRRERPELRLDDIWVPILARAADGRWVPEILALLRNANSWIAKHLIPALGRIGDPRALEELTRWLHAGRPDAAEALLSLGQPGMEALKAGMRSEDPRVREAVVNGLFSDAGLRVLAESDDREVREIIGQLADTDPVSRIRLYAGAVRHRLVRGTKGAAWDLG
ncbi:MAG: HEAT repeat domain-containing protein [Armatimonadetes bacterium]|nr:HEAT repeat domain-containing protein [Armatimonadota bacterium]